MLICVTDVETESVMDWFPIHALIDCWVHIGRDLSIVSTVLGMRVEIYIS